VDSKRVTTGDDGIRFQPSQTYLKYMETSAVRELLDKDPDVEPYLQQIFTALPQVSEVIDLYKNTYIMALREVEE